MLTKFRTSNFFGFIKENSSVLVFFIIGIISFVTWFIFFSQDIYSLQSKVVFENKDDWFMDFFNVVYWSKDLHPYDWGWLSARNYLPLVYLTVYPFTKLYDYNLEDFGSVYGARYTQASIDLFMLLMIFLWGLFFWCLSKTVKDSKKIIFILAPLFLSRQVLFSIDRANLIIFSTACMYIFLLTYDSDNKLKKNIGLLAIIIASVFKIYPCILGVLLLHKKDYISIIKCIIGGMLFSFVPFFFLNGGFLYNVKAFINCMHEYSNAPYGSILGIMGPEVIVGVAGPLWVMYIMAILAVIASFFINEKWKKILILTLAVILTARLSGDYCLMYLFFPIAVFLAESKQSIKKLLITILFNIIIMPFIFEYQIGTRLVFNNFTLTNSICMLMYFVLIIEGLIKLVVYLKNNKIQNV